MLSAVSLAALMFAGLAALSATFWQRSMRSEYEAVIARDEAERATVRAVALAGQANQTAARASFYEGLYWLKAGNEGVGGQRLQQGDWSRAMRAFDQGLESLGESDATVEDLSLRELLDYGRRFVLLCGGFGGAGGDGRVSSQAVRDYYNRIRMPSCSGGNRPARPSRTALQQ